MLQLYHCSMQKAMMESTLQRLEQCFVYKVYKLLDEFPVINRVIGYFLVLPLHNVQSIFVATNSNGLQPSA